MRGAAKAAFPAPMNSGDSTLILVATLIVTATATTAAAKLKPMAHWGCFVLLPWPAAGQGVPNGELKFSCDRDADT
jgi:hypothetical protein